VDDSEKQIEKIIQNEQPSSRNKNKKKEETSLQHRYIRIENVPELPIVQIPFTNEEDKNNTYSTIVDSGQDEKVIVNKKNNMYNPTVKGIQCSVNCEEAEKWLMDWYKQYTQYSDKQKAKSKLLDAIKDIKNRYDQDRIPYSQQFKSLLAKFELLSDK
jgi:hypothetical protein